MSSTINGLLEDTDFGGMLNDIFAMDNWEQDICPQMNKVDDFTEEEPPDFPVLTPEEMEKEADLYEQTDHSMPESSKFGWARSLEYIYDGGSVLQLIDAYLALPVRGDLQYIISRSGIAYPMKALENYNVALPTDIARCMTTGIHLLDSFYLSRICEKLREMKYKKPDTSVPW